MNNEGNFAQNYESCSVVTEGPLYISSETYGFKVAWRVTYRCPNSLQLCVSLS